MPADNTAHLITAARRRHELTHARAIRALRELDRAGEHITFEIVARKEDATDRAKARSNVEDIINARPDLSMVVGLWNYNGPAIVAAIEALGKKGKVLAVGPGRLDDNGKRVPMEVSSGDRVLYSKYAGTEVKLDGEELLVVSSRDILAKIG